MSTKAEELAFLQGFIDSLSDDSYLRPWLEQERAAIARAMECDVPLENYAHGFQELITISNRLEVRKVELDKRERELRRAEELLRDDRKIFAGFVTRIATESRQHTTLAENWAREASKV